MRCPKCPITLEFAIRHIPLMTGVVFVFTVIISYVWAITNGHVPPVFPFISDTGTFAPESCFFGMLLNIGAVLVAMTVYLRYLELRDFVRVDIFPRFRRLSKLSVVLGLIASFGVSMVANFQEVNQIELHILGAFMVFGLGAIYMWIETYITYKIHPGGESRLICYVRIILSTVGLLAFISMIVFIAVASHFYKPLNGRTPVNWLPEDGGWALKVCSAASEWVVASTEILFFSTYTREFHRFRLSFPRLLIVEAVETTDTSDAGSVNNGDAETLVTAAYLS